MKIFTCTECGAEFHLGVEENPLGEIYACPEDAGWDVTEETEEALCEECLYQERRYEDLLTDPR